MTLEEVINYEIESISSHINYLEEIDEETKGKYSSISEEITYMMGHRAELFRLRELLWQGDIKGIYKEDCK